MIRLLVRRVHIAPRAFGLLGPEDQASPGTLDDLRQAMLRQSRIHWHARVPSLRTPQEPDEKLGLLVADDHHPPRSAAAGH